ncbi:hypothetical protein BZ160_16575 [Pantoea vagans]|nr:hypothetical protein BZ160_16575 [Pantoea vagans]
MSAMTGAPHQKTNDSASQRLQCLMGSAHAAIPDTAQRFAQTFASHFTARCLCGPLALFAPVNAGDKQRRSDRLSGAR